MQTSTLKTIFTASITLLILACNNNSKKVKVQEVTLQDIRKEEEKPEPPPPPPPKTDPPKVEMKKAATKCYVNEGLNYKTTITIFYDGDDIKNNKIAGNVQSEEFETGKKESKRFAGTMDKGQINVSFDGDPPVIGAASEWTDKSWRIKKVNGKEVLEIIFNAKSYETNKWKETVYEFESGDCK